LRSEEGFQVKKKETDYSVTGVITDREAGQPIQGVKVRACDKDLRGGKLLGEESTAGTAAMLFGLTGRIFPVR
jgi:hypothetical protein